MTTRSTEKLEEQTALMLASLQEQGQQQAQQLRQQIDLLALNQDQRQRELVEQFSRKMTECSDKQEGLEKRLATLEEDLQLLRLDEQERREERERRPPSIENPISGDAAERVGCIPRNLQGPGNFDGCSSWDAYVAQFEMLARLNCWTDKQKAIYLAVSLKGSALTVPTNLPQADVYDYQRLKEALA